MSAARDRFIQIKNIAEAGMTESDTPFDVAALRREIVLLRGTLRYVYQQTQKLQLAIDPMYTNSFDEAEAQAADDIWKTIHHATGNYQADTQTIIGEDVNIPIPDTFP